MRDTNKERGIKKRLPVMEDYARMVYLGDPVGNAALGLIAWGESYWLTDGPKELRRFIERVHMAKVRDGALTDERIITAGGTEENSPSILADGTLLFLSDAGNGAPVARGEFEQRTVNEFFIAPQLYSYKDGAAKKLTHMLHGVNAYKPSPDGKRVLFTSWQYEADSDGAMLSERDPNGRAEAARKAESEPLFFETQRFKSDAEMGHCSKRAETLWSLELSSGKAVRVLDKEADFSAPCWTNGGSILYESTEDGKLCFNVIDPALEDTKSEMLLSVANIAMCLDDDCCASFTADRRTLIFAGSEPDAEYADPRALYKVSAEGGEDITARRLTDRERDIDGIMPQDMNFNSRGDQENEYVLHSDGFCYYTTGVDGDVRIARVRADGENSAPELVTPPMQNYHALSSFGDKLLALCGMPYSLPELALIDTNTGEATLLTDCNPWMREVELHSPEKTHTSTGIQGYYIAPYGETVGSNKRAPLILYCHGGPTGFYCSAMNYEYHALAAAGFGVFYANPRGGTGFGRERGRDALAYDGTAMNDLILAVDELCLEHEELDHTRVGICGGSYGGYMTLWAISHSSRFRAACAQRPLANMQMISASSHSAGGHSREQHQEYTDKLRQDIAESPTSYMDNVHIPLLIQQSELDANCVMEQAKQALAAMRALAPSVPSELKLYPLSNHGLLYRGPLETATAHRLDTLDWMKRYL